jgi:hypothetical protein
MEICVPCVLNGHDSRRGSSRKGFIAAEIQSRIARLMIHCSLKYVPYIFPVLCRNALLFVVIYPAFHGRYLIGAGLKWGAEVIGPSLIHHKLVTTAPKEMILGHCTNTRRRHKSLLHS